MLGPTTVLHPLAQRFRRFFEEVWDNQQRVEILGWKHTGAGSDVALRYRASRATQYVIEHVQSTGVGLGGATYSTSNRVSRTRVDCRQNRQQDATITRNGTDDYYVWLIPSFEDEPGTYTDMDGADGDDFMAFLYLGT